MALGVVVRRAVCVESARMANCHIAENHESGMTFSFDVAPAAPSSA